MKIELSKEQYKDLLTMGELASSIVGVLGDSISDGGHNYKEMSERFENVQKEILKHAREFGCENLIEEFEDEIIITERFYEDVIFPIIEDNNEMEIFEGLAGELARRDFRRDHTEQEIGEMAKRNSGYFGVELHAYEKKYWDEFAGYGYDRLEIVEEIS